MTYVTKVKICGITNLEDATAAVQVGAFALGFNFYRGSSRYIDPRMARTIIERFPRDVLSVGVFVNEPEPSSVLKIADEAGVGAIQLHGDESPEFCSAMNDRYVIKALRVDSDFAPERAVNYGTQAILLDAFSTGSYGGTGTIFDWTLARRTRELVPIMYLAGGLTVDNVADAISIVRPFAVDVCSSLEVSPGRKNHTLLRTFFESVRGAC